MTLLGFPILLLGKMLFAAFNGTLFAQSGFDKVQHYKGNLSYLTDYFKNSPLASMVSILMPIITILEVAAGVLSLLAVLLLLIGHESGNVVGAWGMLLGAKSMACLFIGQRLAKDYGGSASSVPYFLMAVGGLLLYML